MHQVDKMDGFDFQPSRGWIALFLPCLVVICYSSDLVTCTLISYIWCFRPNKRSTLHPTLLYSLKPGICNLESEHRGSKCFHKCPGSSHGKFVMKNPVPLSYILKLVTRLCRQSEISTEMFSENAGTSSSVTLSYDRNKGGYASSQITVCIVLD
jgi:hypothetical protein